ncbi:MAG TPA: PPOX class F420-dependent oxidoreductase [Acidimicrobiales bacterium]|nr:PPOX class F420-dependent oxidoreductase [Acidimicrobiales bacterium]
MRVEDVITPGNPGAFTVGDRSAADSLDHLAPVHRAMLDRPVTAVLATEKANGRPQLTPVWCNTDGVHVQINTARGRLKDRNLRSRPRASLLLLDPEDPYHWLMIEGDVAETVDEDDADRGHEATTTIDDLAESYLGQRPYPLRAPEGEVRVLHRVLPTRIMTFGPAQG